MCRNGVELQELPNPNTNSLSSLSNIIKSVYIICIYGSIHLHICFCDFYLFSSFAPHRCVLWAQHSGRLRLRNVLCIRSNSFRIILIYFYVSRARRRHSDSMPFGYYAALMCCVLIKSAHCASFTLRIAWQFNVTMDTILTGIWCKMKKKIPQTPKWPHIQNKQTEKEYEFTILWRNYAIITI